MFATACISSPLEGTFHNWTSTSFIAASMLSGGTLAPRVHSGNVWWKKGWFIFTSPLLGPWGTVIYRALTYASGPSPMTKRSHHTHGQQVKNAQYHWPSGKSNPQWNTASYLLEWRLWKRQEMSDDTDAEKRKSLCTVGGNVDRHGHYEKRYGASSKNRVAKRSSNSTSAICPEEVKSLSQRDVSTPTFTAALFTVAETWK